MDPPTWLDERSLFPGRTFDDRDFHRIDAFNSVAGPVDLVVKDHSRSGDHAIVGNDVPPIVEVDLGIAVPTTVAARIMGDSPAGVVRRAEEITFNGPTRFAGGAKGTDFVLQHHRHAGQPFGLSRSIKERTPPR